MQLKKKLLIDFDDTICQSVTLEKVNNFLGTNYSINDFDNYLIDDIIPPERVEDYFIKYFENDPYENIPLMDGAKEALKKLNEKYDIYVCSACFLYKSPGSSANLFSSKFNYLVKNLPFLDPKKFIFTASKDVVYGDILIDDHFDNFKNSFVKTKLMFSSYHNKNLTDEMLKERGVKRVKDWAEICDILL